MLPVLPPVADHTERENKRLGRLLSLLPRRGPRKSASVPRAPRSTEELAKDIEAMQARIIKLKEARALDEFIQVKLGEETEGEVAEGTTMTYMLLVKEMPTGYGLRLFLRNSRGDADLFVSQTTRTPSPKAYQWAASGDGNDLLRIPFNDPALHLGPLYIGVYGFGASAFKLLVTVVPMKSRDQVKVKETAGSMLESRLRRLRRDRGGELATLYKRVGGIYAERAAQARRREQWIRVRQLERQSALASGAVSSEELQKLAAESRAIPTPPAVRGVLRSDASHLRTASPYAVAPPLHAARRLSRLHVLKKQRVGVRDASATLRSQELWMTLIHLCHRTLMMGSLLATKHKRGKLPSRARQRWRKAVAVAVEHRKLDDMVSASMRSRESVGKRLYAIKRRLDDKLQEEKASMRHSRRRVSIVAAPARKKQLRQASLKRQPTMRLPQPPKLNLGSADSSTDLSKPRPQRRTISSKHSPRSSASPRTRALAFGSSGAGAYDDIEHGSPLAAVAAAAAGGGLTAALLSQQRSLPVKHIVQRGFCYLCVREGRQSRQVVLCVCDDVSHALCERHLKAVLEDSSATLISVMDSADVLSRCPIMHDRDLLTDASIITHKGRTIKLGLPFRMARLRRRQLALPPTTGTSDLEREYVREPFVEGEPSFRLRRKELEAPPFRSPRAPPLPELPTPHLPSRAVRAALMGGGLRDRDVAAERAVLGIRSLRSRGPPSGIRSPRQPRFSYR